MQTSLSLLDARKILNLTQVQMADRLDVTAEYVSMIENGKKVASKKLLNKLGFLLAQSHAPPAPVQQREEPCPVTCPHCGNKDKEITWLREQLSKAQDNLAAALAAKPPLDAGHACGAHGDVHKERRGA